MSVGTAPVGLLQLRSMPAVCRRGDLYCVLTHLG